MFLHTEIRDNGDAGRLKAKKINQATRWVRIGCFAIQQQKKPNCQIQVKMHIMGHRSSILSGSRRIGYLEGVY
jgi:hypothetical protein